MRTGVRLAIVIGVLAGAPSARAQDAGLEGAADAGATDVGASVDATGAPSEASSEGATDPPERLADTRSETPTPCGDRPGVVLRFPGRWDAALRRAVRAELTAALDREGFDVCDEGVEGSVADLQLRASGTGVAVMIEVRDAVTAKRVEREISLRGFPADSRALAVAVAADELLRASWAELALEDAPAPQVTPPPAVERAVETRIRPRSASPTPTSTSTRTSRRFWLLAGAEMAHFTGGTTLLGGGVQLEGWGTGPIGGVVALGLRRALRDHTRAGDVEADGFSASLGMLLRAVGDADGVHLAIVTGLGLISLRYDAQTPDGDRGDRGQAVFARAGLRVGAGVGPFAVRLDMTLGAPLRGVEVTDGASRLTGAAGVELAGALWLGVAP